MPKKQSKNKAMTIFEGSHACHYGDGEIDLSCKNEKILFELAYDYLVFIDETGDPFVHFDLKTYDDHSIFPVMTVSAVIIPTKVYQEIFVPGMDAIKEKYFHNKNIYFHSREIRRKDGIYKIFLDEKIYSEFKKDINDLMAISSITIISSSINKMRLAEKANIFRKQTGSAYNVGDVYLRNVDYVLERLGHFLKEKTAKIIFETRGKKESKKIQGVLDDAKDHGTFYCPKKRFSNIDKEILFFCKKDNINGLQLVDYCAYPFARHAKNNDDNDNKFFDILRKYIYSGDYNEYGLKEWP